MVYVVDSIMGSGKSSCTIQSMNEHPERRYLYISRYIEEAERIRDACPNLAFALPASKGGRSAKMPSFIDLLRKRRNIALTHELFTRCDAETLDLIKNSDYFVFIDEVVNIVKSVKFSKYESEFIGFLSSKNGGAQGVRLCESLAESDFDFDGMGRVGFALDYVYRNGEKICNKNGDISKMIFWTLPKELFAVSGNVFVLTYLFEGTYLKAYMEMNHIPYKKIGVRKTSTGYEFTQRPTLPDYTEHLSSLIHVFNGKHLNDIGNEKTALSAAWYDKAVCLENDPKSDINRLRKNIAGYFDNVLRGVTGGNRMWSTFKNGRDAVCGGAVAMKRFVPFNSMATNKYRDRRALAYCVNIFPNPFISRYFNSRVEGVDYDKFALSTMLQWIWRSAIREGKEVWIYVPSKRMRTLLLNWIEDVEREKAEEIANGESVQSIEVGDGNACQLGCRGQGSYSMDERPCLEAEDGAAC